MTGKTHLIIGIASYLALDNQAPPAGLLLAGIGSLLPDIDHPNSTISRKIKPVRWIYSLLFFWTKHRQFSHSIAIALPLAALAYYLQNQHLTAFTIGYISHILADMITAAGVPILYPISAKSHHLAPRIARIKTGGIIELFIAVAALVATTLLIQMRLNI